MPLTPDEKTIFTVASKYLSKQPVVFDVGAYKGYYSEFVLSLLPEADCFLFEANKILSNDLSKKYYCFNVAVGKDNGDKTFYTCLESADELSSLYNRPVFGDVKMEPVTVTCTTIDKFCTDNNIDVIDFLKIDAEGAELDILLGSEIMLREKRIAFAQVEYGGTYPDAGITFMQIISFVTPFGYKVYELIDGKMKPVTKENFVEDYRYTNFLITHHDLR
jgi:FkbM family methyltransferase